MFKKFLLSFSAFVFAAVTASAAVPSGSLSKLEFRDSGNTTSSFELPEVPSEDAIFIMDYDEESASTPRLISMGNRLTYSGFTLNVNPSLALYNNDVGFLTSADLAAYLTYDGAANIYVPLGRTVNGIPLAGNIVLTKSDFSDLNQVQNTSDADKPVSTATQTALNLKANSTHTHVANDITDATTVGKNVLKASDAAAARTAIGAGISSFSGSYADLTSKPFIPVLVVGASSKPNAFPIAKSVTVATGNAVWHLTSDGTSTGTALCPNGNVYLDSMMVRADNEVDTPFSFGQPALSNSNKTITIAVKKAANITTLPIIGALTGALLGAPVAANGSVVKTVVWCD